MDPKDHLWLPDAYIYNVKEIKRYNLVHDYEEFYFAIRNNENLFTYDIDVEIVFFCEMIFDSYPMDIQICHLLFGSYSGIEKSKQRYKLGILHFNTSQQVALLDYEFKVNNLSENLEYWTDHKIPNWGTFQRTGFELKFQRVYERYLMSYYIPSGILVILSWVSL